LVNFSSLGFGRMSEEVDYRELVVELKQKPENKKCADCGSTETKWTSTNLGIFLCPDCSGVHRNLGTHITKVRSTILVKKIKLKLKGSMG
jgi:ribosomal protein L37AE/L43A